MSSFWKRWGPHATRMRAAALTYPEILRRLADAPDKTFHVYAIRLDALIAAEPEADAHAVATALNGGDLAALLSAGWGVVPPGALAALDRCGATVRDGAFYDRLRRVLLDPRLGPMLLRSKDAINRVALGRIEAMMDVAPALDAAFGNAPPQCIAALEWLLRRLRATEVEIDGKRLGKKLRSITHDNWNDTVHSLALMHPGVRAPWPGTARLAPIESPRDLKRTGQKLRNCLGSLRYALRLIRDVDAFYVWHGEEVAALQISTLGHGEWEVTECLGAGNKGLKAETIKAIEAELATAPILIRRNVSRRLLAHPGDDD